MTRSTIQVGLHFPNGNTEVRYLHEVPALGSMLTAAGRTWTVARVDGREVHMEALR